MVIKRLVVAQRHFTHNPFQAKRERERLFLNWVDYLGLFGLQTLINKRIFAIGPPKCSSTFFPKFAFSYVSNFKLPLLALCDRFSNP